MSNNIHPSPDPNQQQRLAVSPSASVWVSASAGTGKTKVLTDRVLSLLLTGSSPQRILCLTFTRAAAAEMEFRILDRLGQWTMAEEGVLRNELTELLDLLIDDELIHRARLLFASVLDTPGGMNIQTIHAFCQSLLGRFPLEARLSPHFNLMEERDAEEMLIIAREQLLNRARIGVDERLGEALAKVTAHIHEAKFPELLAEVTSARGRLQRLITTFGSVEGVISNVEQILSVSSGETLESVVSGASQNNAINEAGLRSAVKALSMGNKNDEERGVQIQHWLDNPSDRIECFFDYASIFLTNFNKLNFNVRKTLITKFAQEKSPEALGFLLQEARRLECVIMHWRSVALVESTSGLLVLGEALLVNYQAQKEAKALLDYDDLILMASELLHRKGVAPWVLFKLDGGIDHILVDEAQDTSPEQWSVIEALTQEFFVGMGTHENIPTFFAVGDIKQSIYSFQGADPVTFSQMNSLFSSHARGAEKIWRPINLTVSFRSTSAVLSAVDAVFKSPLIADGVTFDDEIMHHDVWRTKAGGLVELWPPVIPRGSSVPKSWKPPVERISGDVPQTRLARLIAGRIERMVRGKEILEARGRPIEPRDILILVRRRTGFVEDMVRALKELDIEVSGVDRMVLTEQLAVMDLIAFGQFLLLPEDDLTLATILKSPLLGLNENQLFELAYKRRGSLWQSLIEKKNTDPQILFAYEELSHFMARSDFIPPFEIYNELLSAHNGRKKLVSRLGPDALDPISEFLNLALLYEKSHSPSLEGFLHWVVAGEVEIKRDLEQSIQQGVRVMTVHGAKGLEAPIVFLPDTLQVPKAGSSLLWHQDESGKDKAVLWPPRQGLFEKISQREYEQNKRRREQEYRRLLYVAMTRAEDRLYVCGWGTKKKPPEDCWYNMIKSGLSDIGGEILDHYLEEMQETENSTVLRLTAPQTGATAKTLRSQESEYDDLPYWVFTDPAYESPSPVAMTPSKPDDEQTTIISPLQSYDEGYFMRGKIIHRLLQTLPELEPGRREETIKKFLSRDVYGFSLKEQKEIAIETLSILNDPVFAPIFGSGSRAEVPLIGSVAGQVISAQIDRLVITENKVLIVDFKTNRLPPTSPDKIADTYLYQMAAYCLALKNIFSDKEIKCALLWTVVPYLVELEADQLVQYEPKDSVIR